MKRKDTITIWLLIFFVLVPFGRASFAFEDALRLSRPISTVLFDLGVTLVVAASGLFLIVRFVHLTNDLEYYESQEGQRAKDLVIESSRNFSSNR
jgi:hypothetical protein